MNNITIIGNLTADPTTRTVNGQNGPMNVADFTVAVNRRRGSETLTDFFRVSLFGKMGENAAKYLHKGSKVGVAGEATGRAYTANDGSARIQLEVTNVHRVEYLSARQNDNQGGGGSPGNNQGTAQAAPDNGAGFAEVYDDELPF